MNRIGIFLIALVLPVLMLPEMSLAQQDKPKGPTKLGDERIFRYLAAETDKLSKKVFAGATTLEEWKQCRPGLHKEYLYMLGLDPLPEKTPLHVTFTGTLEHEGILIDKLHFQSRPGLYVTANLYRPKGIEKKQNRYPAVLYVCGHSNRGRNGNKSAFQDHGIWFARNGYICLILDTLQLGEIPGVHHGTYGVPYNHLARYGIEGKNKVENRWWWHSAGYTPAGVECWNGIRAIDYLVSRPDVDAERIAVTGISGGGAATFWIAAADERVACAVPVSGMSDLESYVKNKVINGHCDCMFLYNTFQWEWTTIAALIAPRPLMFANSDNDRIFPMDGNRRIAERLSKLYKWYGKEDHFAKYVSEGGHAYRPDLRMAIFKFINKHIKGDTGPVEDSAKFKPLPGEKLRVFPTDEDIPKDQINTRIDEMFVPKWKVELPEEGKFSAWRKGLVKELREKCFRPFPNRIPAAEPYQAEANGLEIEWLFTQQPLDVKFVSYPARSRNELGTLFVRNADEKVSDLFQDAERVFGKRDRDVLLTRGIHLPWTQKSPPNYVERSHVLLGMTVDQGRVWDIASTCRVRVKKRWTKSWKVVGRGQAGILAAYAALFEPTITEVVIIDPPTSHMQGPHFLNVLRVLDVPEALGLLAPRVKLTLINAKNKAFDRTAEIYRLAGAGKKFKRK